MKSLHFILLCLLDLVLYALPSYCVPAVFEATMATGINSSGNLPDLVSTSIASTHGLAKRDPCSYDPEPILYHEYGTDICPPRFHLLPNGECEDDPDNLLFCATYCNIRTNFFYTYEEPFLTNSYCLGKMRCTISESQQRSWSWKTKVNLNFNIGFIKGGVRLTSRSATPVSTTDKVQITGGYSGAVSGTGLSRSSSVDLDFDECGYFTFLPIVKESCGSFTAEKDLTKRRNVDCDQLEKVTWPNVCVKDAVTYQPKIAINGPAIRGDTCFVRTNCSNHQRLPMDQQNPAYRHSGVTLPQEWYDGYAAYFSYLATVPISSLEGLTMACDGDDGAVSIHPGLQPMASLSDCQVNLQNLLLTPQNVLGIGGPFRKGDKVWLQSFSTCVVVFVYDIDWDPDCRVSWAEVAATIQMILQTCDVQEGGLIGGKRQLRAGGKCDSTVFVGGHT